MSEFNSTNCLLLRILDASTTGIPKNRSMALFGIEPMMNVSSSSEEEFSTKKVTLPPPVNISVILISWFPPAVRVNWTQARGELRNTRMHAFQIIYYPVTSR